MSPIRRREFLVWSAAGLAAARLDAQDKPAAPDLDWRDVRDWGVEGRGWSETARYFDRLPARAEKLVRPPVWGLSRHSAGMLARFETDAPSIHARWSLLHPALAMSHMPATGVSGVDLYARDAEGRDRWLAVGRPDKPKMEARLAAGIDPLPERRRRLYTAYLPLYNGTEQLEIGVPKGASFEATAPRKEKPIVFYGTSIMHGACASRPGMALPAILGRRFGRPTINLGFSGNGRMEPELADLLAELDPCLYAIDCLPNLRAEEVAERAAPLVRRLRKDRPQTPIVLVEDRSFASAPLLRERREHHAASRAALRKAFETLKAEGVPGLHYLEGEGLIGADGEGSTDGSHPNDLGFQRYADAYEPVLRKALG
jgi:lysophospholipase L1-like esterase